MILICDSAHARQDQLSCLAPVVPMIALPDDVLAEYRAEIAAEFEVYFDALTGYITCLDTERVRALAEAHLATEAYSALLEILPSPKDLL